MLNFLKAIQGIQSAVSEGGWPNATVLSDLAQFTGQGGNIWVSEVDPSELQPVELKLSEVKPISSSNAELEEVIPKDSFLRFFALEPLLSTVLRGVARPKCPECRALTDRFNKEELLRRVGGQESGFMVLSLMVTDQILQEMTIGVALDVIGSRSVIVDNKRCSGGDVDKIVEKILGEVSSLRFILKTFSLPLSSADTREILYERQFCDNSAGSVGYSIILNPTDDLKIHPLNFEFICPNGHALDSPVGAAGCRAEDRFIGDFSLRSISTRTLVQLKSALDSEPLASEIVEKLVVLIEAGFGDYPAGYALKEFSSGEMLRAGLARFLLTCTPDAVLDITAASGLLEKSEEIALKKNLSKNSAQIKFAERLFGNSKSSVGLNGNLSFGPYRNSSYEIAQIKILSSGINLIEGPTGVGKSFILESLKGDAKIKKEFSQIRFLRESSYFNQDSLSATLGISKSIADIFASTLEARSLGLKASSFDISNSAKLCPECRKAFDIGEIIECEACEGQLLIGSAASVSYKNLLMVDILRLSVNDALDLFAGFRDVRRVLELVKSFGLAGYRLGDRLAALPIICRELLPFLRFVAELPQGPALVLLSHPFRSFGKDESGRSLGFAKRGSSLLKELAEGGHTIVVADNSGCLYEVAHNVIRLTGSRVGNGSLQIRIRE